MNWLVIWSFSGFETHRKYNRKYIEISILTWQHYIKISTLHQNTQEKRNNDLSLIRISRQPTTGPTIYLFFVFYSISFRLQTTSLQFFTVFLLFLSYFVTNVVFVPYSNTHNKKHIQNKTKKKKFFLFVFFSIVMLCKIYVALIRF